MLSRFSVPGYQFSVLSSAFTIITDNRQLLRSFRISRFVFRVSAWCNASAEDSRLQLQKGKSEYRNTKYETNPNIEIQMIETHEHRFFTFRSLPLFVIRSCFEFRDSCFGFPRRCNALAEDSRLQLRRGKSEYRNTKQIRILETQMTKTHGHRAHTFR